MKVVVTGGSGRVGRFTVEELIAGGHTVCSLDWKRSEALPGECMQIQADLGDAGEVYDGMARFRPEAVCHIAANPSPSDASRQGTFANNVLSTYNVFQAAGDFGVHRLIYAGSEMATGWLTTEELPPRFPFTEEDRTDSPNAYALSKYLGEVIADSMVARHPDMAVCTLRINNVIMPDWYHLLEERRSNFMEKGDANFWSYIDVRDAASAFRAALEGESGGHEVFLVAAADNCLDIPLPEAVKRRYGKEGKFAAGFQPHQSAFDISKFCHWFGWKPRYSWRKTDA